MDIGFAITVLWATLWLCEPGIRKRTSLKIQAPKIEYRPVRIHLSTALTLTTETGLLLLLNFTPSPAWTPAWFTHYNPDWSGLYGWPLGFNSLEPPEHITFGIDIGFGIGLLLLTGWACESIISYRSKKRTVK